MVEGKKNVLVCEDNKMVQNIMKALLTSLGAIPTITENGEEGVNAVKTEPAKYRCIFMDFLMPVKDGFEAAAEIRKIDPSIPIIGLSGGKSINCKNSFPF